MQLQPSVVYRQVPGRISQEDYNEAIQELECGKTQLDPDGDNCHICHDSGHQAWECHHNPLVMARRAAQLENTWRCFHCRAVFANSSEAAEHFGVDRDHSRPPLCQMLTFKQLKLAALLPTRASELAAGYDLSSIEEVTLREGQRALVHTGLSVALPAGTYGRVAPRSGLAFKQGLDVLAGVIDEDYRGEIGVILINLNLRSLWQKIKDFLLFRPAPVCRIKPGDRIAQFIVTPIQTPPACFIEELPESGRGSGGWGSSGA